MRKILILLIAVLALGALSATAVADNNVPGENLYHNGVISKGDMISGVMSYLSGSGSLNDSRDAAYVYTYWGGEPKTIVDSANETVTIYKPVNRIVVLTSYGDEALCILGDQNKIVAIDTYTQDGYYPYFPQQVLSLPTVGNMFQPDYEAITAMQPDLVITDSSDAPATTSQLSTFGIPVVGLDLYKYQTLDAEMTKLGYLLDSGAAAQKYLTWRAGYENIITSYLQSHPNEYTPKFYVEMNMGGNLTWGEGSPEQAMCDLAGGNNIAKNLGEYSTVDPEWVLQQNPDIIVFEAGTTETWGWNNSSQPESLIATLESRPGWSDLNAFKNNSVYVINEDIVDGPSSIVGLAYFAKWMHPGVSIDPMQVYADYLKTFFGVQYPAGLTMVYPS